jgi:hypothetical protein
MPEFINDVIVFLANNIWWIIGSVGLYAFFYALHQLVKNWVNKDDS